MSQFFLFRFADNPIPATQSSQAAASQKNYLVQIKSHLANESEHVFAFVTEFTGEAVFGEQAIADLGLVPDTEGVINLVCDVRKHRFPLKVRVKPAVSGGTVTDDYMQLGWATIAAHFNIEKETPDGIRQILAKNGAACLPYDSK